MVKIRHFLPDSSDSASLKVQLIQSGVLDKTNELIYRMSPGAVDPAILRCGSLSFQRYTKSALLLLREEELSKAEPKCLNDIRTKLYPIWKSPPPKTPSATATTTINIKTRDPEPARKHFSILPAFAARRNIHTSDTSVKEDDRRKMFDKFTTVTHPPHPSSIWSQKSSTLSQSSNQSAGSFFPDNNNSFMENYQRMMDRRDEATEIRYSDEPEWMNCGPTSRLDVIELRGFESDGEDDSKKKEVSGNTEAGESDSPPARSTPAKDQGNISSEMEHCNDDTDDKHNDDPKLDFNFDFLTDESNTSSILVQDKSNGNVNEKNSKGHVWFADDLRNLPDKDSSVNESNKLMEFFLKGKQIRALVHGGGCGALKDSEKIPTLNDIEAKIIPEVRSEGLKKTCGTTLNPAAAPFVKKDVRATVLNEQTEIVNKLYSQISANHTQANAIAANLNILKALQHQNQLQQQVNQRVIQQQAQFQQLGGGVNNSDLLKTPEAQVLLQGLASGQFTFQSLQQQMNQPNKRSIDIIRSVLNYANTLAGQAYLSNIQLIHQLSNKGKNYSSGSMAMNHNLNALNYRKLEQLNQQHLQQVQYQMQRHAMTYGQTKVPIDLHQHTENIMLEAMKRKRQQEILKSQMRMNEDNQGNYTNTNSFDFNRFSLNQNQLNGMFNPKQQPTAQQLQSSINSLMLSKSNADLMFHHHQQQQQQLQQQQQFQRHHHPYHEQNFPINQQVAHITATQQHHHRQNQNPFMGRPILKGSNSSISNSSNKDNSCCPLDSTK